MSACPGQEPLIQTFVDGELADSDRDEFQKHIASCSDCARVVHLQARFRAAVRGHLPRPAVPDTLRARLDRDLDRAGMPGRRGAMGFLRRRPWVALPAAAAAAVAVMVSVRDRSPVMDQQISLHPQPLPLEVTGPDCNRIAGWFQGKVGFPVAMPKPKGYSCQGGRLVNVDGKVAAELVYRDPQGADVKMVVYDARRNPPSARDSVRVKGRRIYIDRGPGVNAVGTQDPGGLGRVVTSSGSADSLVQFVSHGSLQQ